MGLDMYLTKETYIWPSYIKDLPNRTNLKLEGVPGIKPDRIATIVEEVGYWRKANAIHKWFVDNVQNGVDECQKTHVPIEKLERLLELVKEVLAHPSKASKLLPTQSGFFFGSTGYDERYREDLELTKMILENLLEEPNKDMVGIDYYYQSSW